MSTKIILRHDTEANWILANPTLSEGEFGIQTGSTPIKFKIGDGVTPWMSLAWASEGSISQAELAKLAGIEAGAQVNPVRVSSDEKIAGTSNSIRSFAPSDVKDMAAAFAVGSGTPASLDVIPAGATNVHLTTSLKTQYDRVAVRPKSVFLNGTGTAIDNVNIRNALTTLAAAGGGRLVMAGNFMIGHAGDKSGINPGNIPHLEIIGEGGSCRWYKGFAATASGAEGEDPTDGSAYILLSRDVYDGQDKTLIIRDITFEGDLTATNKMLGDASRCIDLRQYDRVVLDGVTVKNVSQMGCAINLTREVRVINSRFERIARDGLNCSNSGDVIVDHCVFSWIFDDAFAMNLTNAYASASTNQMRAKFTNNTVYGAQGIKFLGCNDIVVFSNSFKSYYNYGVVIGQDASFSEGSRRIVDAKVLYNTFEDLVTNDLYASPYPWNTAIQIDQSNLNPTGIVVKGNTIRQKTGGTDGVTWSSLELYGQSGEQRQWRTNGQWWDGTLSGEAFVGQGKAIRVVTANALDRDEYDIEDNLIVGFSDEDVIRETTAWAGTQSWTIPLAPQEFPASGHRVQNVDCRGYTQIRAVVNFSNAPLANTQLYWRYTIDGGLTWRDTPTTITASATTGNQWGGWVDLPFDARIRESVTFSLWGKSGNGAELSTLVSIEFHMKSYVKPDVPRVSSAEITAGTEVEERKFSPADVRAISQAFGGAGAPSMSQVEADAGTSTDDRIIKPSVLKGAITTHGITREPTSVDAFSKMWVGPRRTWDRIVSKPANTIALLHKTAVQTFNVQHGKTNVPLGSNSKTLPINTVNVSKSVLIPACSRPYTAGYHAMSPDGDFAANKDVSLSTALLDASTLRFSRQYATAVGDVLASYSLVEFLGAADDPYAIVNHGTYTVQGTHASFTVDMTDAPVSLAKCIPVITGIETDGSRVTAIAYMSGTKTINVELQGMTATTNTKVMVNVVEFRGSAWKVHHAYAASQTDDSGSLPLKAGILGTGSSTSIDDWTKAFIISQWLADTDQSSNMTANAYPRMRPGTNAVDYVFNAAHSGTEHKGYAYVVEDIGMDEGTAMVVTRYNDIAVANAGWTNVDVTSAGLVSTSEALAIVSATSGISGFPHGVIASYLSSNVQVQLGCSRSHSTAATADLQVIKLPRSA